MKKNPKSTDLFFEAISNYRNENNSSNLNFDILKEIFFKNNVIPYNGLEDNLFFLSVDSISSKNFEKLNNLDLNLNYLNHNKNWLYSFTENFFAYSYNITYYIFDNFLFLDLAQLKNQKYWVGSLKFEHLNPVISLIVDQIYSLSIILLPFFNDFLKHFGNSLEFGAFLETHPEYYLIFKNYSLSYYYDYFSNFYLTFYNLTLIESFLTPVMIIFQFFFIFFLICSFFMVYFNYYSSLSSEENLIDHDYLIVNITIEAEEEIGSIDDMLLSSVILLYIFL